MDLNLRQKSPLILSGGMDVLQEIKKKFKNIPVELITIALVPKELLNRIKEILRKEEEEKEGVEFLNFLVY